MAQRLPKSNFPLRYNVAPTDQIPIVRIDPREALEERALGEPHANFENRNASLKLAMFAGLRRAEASGLCWEYVDWVGGFILVRQQLSKYGIGLQPLKTKQSRRDVPMVPAVREALLPIWERQGRPSTGFIFVTRNDEPSACAIYDSHFMFALVKAGILSHYREKAPFTYHGLRHYYGSHLLDQKESPILIAKLMGHTLGTFQRIYAHLIDANTESARAAMTRVSQHLAPQRVASPMRRICAQNVQDLEEIEN